VALADRKVADDPGGWRGDAIVLQLYAPFTHLRVERGEIRLRGLEIVLRGIELVLADRAGFEERLQTFDLRLPVRDVRFAHRALRFGVAHSLRLFFRLDLHQQRSGFYVVARFQAELRR